MDLHIVAHELSRGQSAGLAPSKPRVAEKSAHKRFLCEPCRALAGRRKGSHSKELAFASSERVSDLLLRHPTGTSGPKPADHPSQGPKWLKLSDFRLFLTELAISTPFEASTDFKSAKIGFFSPSSP